MADKHHALVFFDAYTVRHVCLGGRIGSTQYAEANLLMLVCVRLAALEEHGYLPSAWCLIRIASRRPALGLTLCILFLAKSLRVAEPALNPSTCLAPPTFGRHPHISPKLHLSAY